MTSDPMARAREVVLGYHNMRAGGRCDWTHLREAVAEAKSGSRAASKPFKEGLYPGHNMVEGINYNSLDRIVTAFVDAALAREAEIRAGEGWQPIETAPRNGTHLLLGWLEDWWDEESDVTQQTLCVRYGVWSASEDGWVLHGAGRDRRVPASHWRPAPPAIRSAPDVGERDG
jgi:hypothetical protein